MEAAQWKKARTRCFRRFDFVVDLKLSCKGAFLYIVYGKQLLSDYCFQKNQSFLRLIKQCNWNEISLQCYECPLLETFTKPLRCHNMVGKALTLKYRYIEIVASRVKCCFSHFCSFNHYLFSLERCKKSFNAFLFIRRQPSDLFDLQRVYHLKNFVYRVRITKT